MKNLVKKNQLMITALAIMIAIAGYLQFAGDSLESEIMTVNDESMTNVVNADSVITENYAVDGLLELSEEDLLNEELTEIASLDSDVDVVMEDYLDEDMIVEDMTVAEATPQEGEVPGEAVFTGTEGVTVVEEAAVMDEMSGMGAVSVLSDAKLLKEQTRAKNKETLLEIIESDGLTDVQKQEAVDNMVSMTAVAEKESAAEILLEAKGFSDVVVSINGDAVDVVVNASELTDAQRAQIEDIVTRKTEIPAENIIISTVVQD
ncbi:MAG: SpoIIIAH-like family protein [Lachnospiraceae bacterium]|nr:SpoIIIAH-like family protein [Lachnospiraceae bacterium]